jgi:hypothetical protein
LGTKKDKLVKALGPNLQMDKLKADAKIRLKS